MKLHKLEVNKLETGYVYTITNEDGEVRWQGKAEHAVDRLHLEISARDHEQKLAAEKEAAVETKNAEQSVSDVSDQKTQAEGAL